MKLPIIITQQHLRDTLKEIHFINGQEYHLAALAVDSRKIYKLPEAFLVHVDINPAALLAKIGAKKRTKNQRKTSAENGKKGGRPKKVS